MTMAETPEAYFDVKDPIRLGIELSDTGPNALDPLFAILADPDAGPAKKRLVVVTVEQIMKRDMVPKLLPLVADTYDGTTRACAVHLLANAGDAELEPTFVELRSDSDPRVKLAALRGLAALGSEEGRTALTEIYNDAEAPPAHRELAVIDLAAHFAPESMDLMRDVLRKGELTEATQRSAAEAIGRHGVPEDIPLMREVEARATVRSDLLLWTLFAIKNLEELSTADTPDDAVASEAAE
jgi:HEAT repeat protein